MIIVLPHDLGQYLHCYGVKTVRTPNLDAFAAQGVRFARSFCTSPGCTPSRASLFTGRYPHSNGAMGLAHGNFGWDLHGREKHLAQFLNEAGYATVASGVVHETHSGAERCGYEKHRNIKNPDELTTAAIEELKRLAAGNQPFYLYAGYVEPHRLPYAKGPDQPPEGHGFPGPQRSIRTESHKLIANFSTALSFQDPSQRRRPKSDPLTPEYPALAFHPHLELYDLTRDPWEQVNLANQPEHSSVRSELARRLHQQMVATEDPLLRGAVTSPQHETTLRLLRGDPSGK